MNERTADRMDEIREAIEIGAGPPLDELARARIARRIIEGITEQPGMARPVRRRWPLVAAAAGALALAASFALMARPVSAPLLRAPALPPADLQADALELVEPYLLAGTAATDAGAATLGHRRALLEVAERGLVRATLGAATRITLLGPARLQVRAHQHQRVEVELDRGLLLGDYAHERGGELRIASHGLAVVVVGTRFAVEATAGEVRQVAVVRGEVEVDLAGERFRVRAGEAFRPAARSFGPPAPELAALLEEHGASRAPPADAGMLRVTAGPRLLEVRLAGVRLGPLPVIARVAPGMQTVTLTGREVREVSVEVPAGGQATAAPVVVGEAKDPRPARRVEPSHRRWHASRNPHLPRPSLAAAAPPGAATSASAPPRAAPVPALPASPASPPPVPSLLPAQRPPPQPQAPPSASPPPPPRPAGPPPGREVAQSGAESVSPESLYRDAEAALARGSRDEAQRLLGTLIDRHGGDPLARTALYDLALLAYRERDSGRARRLLDRLLASGPPGDLGDPARYLRCMADVQSERLSEAAACLRRFQLDFPDSAHDAEALALRAALAQVLGGCAEALPLLQAYLARYPQGGFAGEASARAARCRAP
jgi:TolA-binding protein